MEKYKVNSLYIVLIVICVLMVYGDVLVEGCDVLLFCLLGIVGEFINFEVWEWYYCVIGMSCCFIIDIWW